MPTHNYICTSGHIEQDVYYTAAAGGADKQRKCPTCGEVSQIHFGAMGAYNRLMSTQGHNQAMPDPQTGMFYENASDKRTKLKALGLEEGDKKTRSQIEAETHDAQKAQMEKRAGAQTLAADSVDEIMQQIDWNKVDRGASGDLNRNVDSAGLFTDQQ